MKSHTRKTATSIEGQIIGRKTFAAISAIEGLVLSAARKKRLDELQVSDLTPTQRREAVIRAYSKKSPRG